MNRTGDADAMTGNAFEQEISPSAFGELIDFGRRTDELDESVVEAQRDGTVSLYNTLTRHGVAYLADEVGMGKTYQALGVVALAWLFEPGADILVVAPSKAVQRSWRTTWDAFIREKLVARENRLADSLLGRPVHTACYCDNLIEFGQESIDQSNRLFLSRISSFSAVRQSLNARRSSDSGRDLKGEQQPTPEDVRQYLHACGLHTPDDVMRPEDVAATLEACELNASLPEGLETGLTESAQINVEIARQMRALLPQFDLVVLDEGHKLRKRGGNIMTRVFSTLLGFRHAGEDARSAEESPDEHREMPRLLSLSATPAHTDRNDIFRVLGFRDERAARMMSADGGAQEDYIQQRMVRRLRRLAGKTKYDYRREEGRPVLCDSEGNESTSGGLNEKDRVQSELLLALVQKRLAHVMGDEQSELNKTVKTGFLETFESFENPSEAHDDIDEGAFTDIDWDELPPDSEVLEYIAQQFAGEFGRDEMPPHPKLSRVEQFVTQSAMADAPDKLLLFVRRRASVRELARRIMARYDECLRAQVNEALSAADDFEEIDDFQTYVHRSLSPGLTDAEVSELLDWSGAETGDAVRHSRMLAPLRPKRRDGKENKRAGYGFQERFRADGGLSGFFNENRVRFVWDVAIRDESRVGAKGDEFEDFVERVLNTGDGVRSRLRALTVEDSNNPVRTSAGRLDSRLLRDLVDWQLLGAIESHAAKRAAQMAGHLRDIIVERRSDDESFDLGLDQMDRQHPEDGSSLPTSIEQSIRHVSVWDALRGRATDSGARLEGPFAGWLAGRFEEVPGGEGLGRRDALRKRDAMLDLMDKNLRMSVGIIDLFLAYDKTTRSEGTGQRQNYAEKMAETFAGRLAGEPEERDTRSRRLLYRLNQTATIFDQLVRKIGVSADEWFDDGAWSDFEQQQPVQDVMGGSGGRKRVIPQFNSPFFPDFVASTSVLREGVDLHLSCNRVWHYGLPHSPGDLEQQSGRIDRYFSKVHRELRTDLNEDVDDATQSGHGELDIGYPYVARSIDETQLGRLLRQKLRVQPLMDKGLSPDDPSREIDLSNLVDEPVEQILEALASESVDSTSPPYPPRRLHEEGPGDDALRLQTRSVLEPGDVGDWLTMCRAEWPEELDVLWCATLSSDLDAVNESPLMLVNRRLDYQNGQSVFAKDGRRHQPTTLSLTHSTEARLHFIRLETPLGDHESELVREFKRRFRDSDIDPGVRLVTRPENDGESEVWRLEAVTEIPFHAGSAVRPHDGLPAPSRVAERLDSLMRLTDSIEAAAGRDNGDQTLDIKSELVEGTLSSE